MTMNWRRLLIWTLAIALPAALAFWAFQKPAIVVEIRPVVLADFERTIDEEGKTRVRDRYLVAAPAAGRLERIALKAGDAVQAGDMVAVLRPTLPQLRDARTISELRERVGAAEARKLAADAQLARTRAALDLARAEARRVDRLADQGFVSPATRDDARLKLAQQEQAVRAARFEQDASLHELALARTSLAQGDQPADGRPTEQPARVVIASPVEGRVLKVIQESEGAVALGAPLLEIGDPRSLEAAVELLSQDALQVAAGMPARLRPAPSLPALQAIVRKVEPSGRTKISTLGVEEQRVNVILDFAAAEGPPETLGDGYRIDASIIVLRKPGVPVVPIGALFRDGEQWTVFVAEQSIARKRAVQPGARNQHQAWIAEGLKPGEHVIVYPPDALIDGAQIRVR
jgi:HlyD family secretion protein